MCVFGIENLHKKILKNLLTNTKQCDMIIKLIDGSQAKQKSLKKLKNNA